MYLFVVCFVCLSVVVSEEKTKWFIFCRSNMCLVCLVWFMWCRRGRLRGDKWIKTKAICLVCLQTNVGRITVTLKGLTTYPLLVCV
ncbi:hypothetical protein F5H01DRAFT_346244 [Linnemannia elongata]|nr:hypothetical protein F5H01DRAFT_346244 [Linnemannia elongata]